MSKKGKIILIVSLLSAVVIAAASLVIYFVIKNRDEKFLLKISPVESTLYVGEEVEFTYETDLSGDAEWSSSDNSIITFFEDGKARAVGTGETTVNVTVQNRTVSAKVTVIPKEGKQGEVVLAVNFYAISLHIGESATITARIEKDGTDLVGKITFLSKNELIVKVNDSGVLTPVALGKAEIEVAGEVEGVKYTQIVYVEISENVIINLSKTDIDMVPLTDGTPTKVNVECFVYKNNQVVENPILVWEVEDESVASVNNGQITANAFGKTVVNVIWQDGENKYNAMINVNVSRFVINIQTKGLYIDAGVSVENLSLKLPGEIPVDQLRTVDAINGSHPVVGYDVAENSILLTKNDVTFRGHNDLYLMTDTKQYNLSVYVADYVINAISDYEEMMDYETYKSEVLKPKDEKREIVREGYAFLNVDLNMYGKTYKYDETLLKFKIHFEGNGHTISNVQTSGLFGNVEAGSVKNLIIKNPIITADADYRGGAVANSMGEGAVIDNVYVIGAKARKNNDKKLGCLVGSVFSAKTTISNCIIVDTLGAQSNLYAIVAKIGDSADKAKFIQTYCISGNAYEPVDPEQIPSAMPSDSRDYYLVNSFADVIEKAGGTAETFGLIEKIDDKHYIGTQGLDGGLEYISVTSVSVKYLDMQNTANLTYSELEGKTVESLYVGGKEISFTSIVGGVSIQSNDLKALGVNGEQEAVFYTSNGRYVTNLILCDKIITSSEQFLAFRNERMTLSDKPAYKQYVALGNDIRLLGAKIGSNDGVGGAESNMSNKFFDTFDGCGYTISSTADDAGIDWNTGLFGVMSGATVKNLVLKNAMIRAKMADVGAFAIQMNDGALLENCALINPFIRNNGIGTNLGYLVGSVYSPNTTIRNCFVYDGWSIKGVQPPASNNGSYTNGVYDNTFNLRGIVGKIGMSNLEEYKTDFENNYCITTNAIIGAIYHDGTEEALEGSIKTSYSAFSQVADLSKFTLFKTDEFGNKTCGGVILYNYAESCTLLNTDNVYVDMSSDYVIDFPELTGKTVEKVIINNTSVEFTLDGGVKIASTALKALGINGEREIVVAISAQEGYKLNAILCDEIIITGEEFLNHLRNRITNQASPIYRQYVALGNSIQIDNTKCYWNTEKSAYDHAPNQDYKYYDTFDGRGYMISAATTAEGGVIWNNGMFANMSGATVKNLIVKDIMIRHIWEGGGTIASQMGDGAILENCVVINPVVRSDGATGKSYGMLVGRFYGENTVIKNCLVYDANSINQTNPNGGFTSGTYSSGIYSGTLQLNGVIGVKGDSGKVVNVINTYCITKNGILGVSAGNATELLPNSVVDSYAAFKAAAGDNLSEFALLKTDAQGNVTCGGVTLYSAL